MIRELKESEQIRWKKSYDGLDDDDIEAGYCWVSATLGENKENNNRCFASIGYNPDEHYADVEVWINGSFGNYTIDTHEGSSISAMKSYVTRNLSKYLRKLEMWDDNY